MSASYIDILLEIDIDSRLMTKLYERRFYFPIVDFQFICSTISISSACGVYISQLLGYSRTSKYPSKEAIKSWVTSGYVVSSCDSLPPSWRGYVMSASQKNMDVFRIYNHVMEEISVCDFKITNSYWNDFMFTKY